MQQNDSIWIILFVLIFGGVLFTVVNGEPEPIACPVDETSICDLIYSADNDCEGIDFINQINGPHYDYKCNNIDSFRHINIRKGE